MHCAFCYLPTFGHAVSNQPRKAPTSLVTHSVSASKNKKCKRVHFTSKLHQVLTNEEYPLFERNNHNERIQNQVRKHNTRISGGSNEKGGSKICFSTTADVYKTQDL